MLRSFIWLEKKPQDFFRSWFTLWILLCLWIQNPRCVGARATDPRVYSKLPDELKVENWVVFDQTENFVMRYLGGLSNAHKQGKIDGHWESLDRWIYMGTEDPYCYIELSYDTWWLQRKGVKEHCATEFATKGCFLLQQKELKTEIEFLETKVVVGCLGLKGSRQQIMHSTNGWLRVHKFVTTDKITTPYGDVISVIDGEDFIQITPHYESMSLWYDKSFHNLELDKNTRTWVKSNWLIVQKTKDLESLLSGSTWLHRDRYTTHTVFEPKEEQGNKCTTIITNGIDVNVLGTLYKTVSTNSTLAKYVQLSCGLLLCKCPPVSKAMLVDHTPERVIHVDREVGVFTKIFEKIEGWVLSIFTYLLDHIFGDNWTIKLLVSSITYYITSQISRSVGAGVAVACLVTYNMFTGKGG
nr:VP1 [Trichopteran jingmen-related virus]